MRAGRGAGGALARREQRRSGAPAGLSLRPLMPVVAWLRSSMPALAWLRSSMPAVVWLRSSMPALAWLRSLMPVVLAVMTSDLVLAGEGGVSAPEPQGLVVSYPRVAGATVRRAIRRLSPSQGPVALSQPPLSVSDSSFIEPLRQRMTPAAGAAAGDAGERCSRLPREATGNLLDDVEKRLKLLLVQEAGQGLEQLELALTCGPEVAARGSISRFHFLTGWYVHEQGQDPTDAFERTLLVAPNYPFPAYFPVPIQEAFIRAHRRASKRPRAPVLVRPDVLAGLELYIDGSRSSPGRNELWLGSHFLQLVGADGRAVAGELVELPPSARDSPPEWPPPELAPPAADEVVARLERAIRQGTLEPPLRHALADVARSGGHLWILVIVPGTLLEPPIALLVEPDGRFRIEPAGAPGAGERSRVASYTAMGFGAATVVSSSVWAYSAIQIKRTYAPGEGLSQEEAAAANLRRTVSAVTSGACLAGTLASAYLYRRMTWRDREKWKAGLLLTAGRGGAAERVVGLELMGRW